MSLLDFEQELFSYGLPLLAEPNPNPPPVPEYKLYIVLCMTLPADQADLLVIADGLDPSHTEPSPPPPPAGGEARRTLSALKRAGHIMSWHAFLDNGLCYVHVQLSRDQAELWYSMIDWVNKTNGQAQMVEKHTF